jgi:ATP-dependent DNA ligase
VFAIAPQLVGNNGLEAMRAAIAAPERYAIEPKVDGVRGLVTFEGDSITIRNGTGNVRERWLGCRPFRSGLERFADRLPIVRDGTVLDGELTAGSFHRTMAVLRGNWPWEASLRLVVFDLPVFAGFDLRLEPWQDRAASA